MRTALIVFGLAATLPLGAALLPACASTEPGNDARRDLSEPRDQFIARHRGHEIVGDQQIHRPPARKCERGG